MSYLLHDNGLQFDESTKRLFLPDFVDIFMNYEEI